MTTNSYKHILTPANIVTMIRILLIPVFVVAFLAPWPSWAPDIAMRSIMETIKPWLAAGVFTLLAFTDSVDGYLARSRNEVTTFGKFLDPLADKILVSAALLALIELGELPSWVVLIIISREFLVSGLRMVVSAEGHVIAASNWGKIKTVVQVIAIICFIIKSNPELAQELGTNYVYLYWGSWAVMIAALLLTLFSMADYFYKSSKVLALPMQESKEKTIAQIDDNSLADEVVALALMKSLKIGTAESCTGGLIAKYLTDIPGSSDVYCGGIVSYSNEVKMDSLDVSQESLKEYGAVSELVAKEMAKGALKKLNVDIAISTTGVAGPSGGTPEKPVGTVWIGVARKNANVDSKIDSSAICYTFGGSREMIRTQAAEEAISILFAKLGSQD